MIVSNANGGVKDTEMAAMKRAILSGLFTLPVEILGANCFNCKYVKRTENSVGTCSNPKVNQAVTDKMCCTLWDQVGVIR
jgi:hypothetical protein